MDVSWLEDTMFESNDIFDHKFDDVGQKLDNYTSRRKTGLHLTVALLASH